MATVNHYRHLKKSSISQIMKRRVFFVPTLTHGDVWEKCVPCKLGKIKKLARGLEPPTGWLQISCSTNWATPALLRHKRPHPSFSGLNWSLQFRKEKCAPKNTYYVDKVYMFKIKVELRGIEPLTSWLPVKRSPSWAMAPPDMQRPKYSTESAVVKSLAGLTLRPPVTNIRGLPDQFRRVPEWWNR